MRESLRRAFFNEKPNLSQPFNVSVHSQHNDEHPGGDSDKWLDGE
jgi:hypothetical protein